MEKLTSINATVIDDKQSKAKGSKNLIDLSNSSLDSNESLGIISIQSDDLGPYIDNLQLKDSRRDTSSFMKEQRALACKTLQDRGCKLSSIPSRFFKPSEMSNTFDSYINISNGSTVNESDVLKQTGINNTSTPKSSICHSELTQKIDIAESMSRTSHEIRNSNMSLSTALLKMEEEYQKIRNSFSVRSDIFKPAEEAESQLLADEASWMKENDLPVEMRREDFTIDNSDNCKMSISTFFNQKSEDISNIIPSNFKKQSIISDLPNINPSRQSSLISAPCSISSVAENSLPKVDLHDYYDAPQKDSLSISKIAQILQNSKETPTKVLDYLLKQCSADERETLEKQTFSSSHSSISKDSNSLSPMFSERTDVNSYPSTLTSDKENINSINIPHQSSSSNMCSSISKSLSSLRSTSSLSNLPGGKLPIKTTHCELVWGCVKAGKSETKQFTIRNKSSSKLRLQCSTSGPLFRIVQERAEDSSNSIKFILHAHETKSISVVFNPLNEGAAADEIIFSPCDPNLQQAKKQSIKLFGYGGIGTVEFRNIAKDSAGRHWFSLGNIFGKSLISEVITVFNKGTLPAFAFFDYTPKDVSLSEVSVFPETVILAPNEQKDINITCKLTSEDVKYLGNCMTSVSEIGIFKMLSGSEATRGRIRRIYKLAMERNLEVDSLSSTLQQNIQDESIPNDILNCRESVNGLKPLYQGLMQNEVMIMVEKDLDSTLVPAMTDETSMFQSFYNESTIIENIKLLCRLEPTSLILTPPSKLRDCLLLSSENEHPLHFEISAPEGIEVIPRSGNLKPYSTQLIELIIQKIDELTQMAFKVSVNVGGQVLNTDIKIVFI
ncbi:hypothetical protein HHI36_000995 [Cryptolaemus montrouzieri]|uniref:Uncharacterized protein n=1 Tax=Cryptolaemus montrouzieri TaxID=559131 RepID=A0ABD2P7L3_9CUCU